jgi:hypothetical protein
LLLFFLALVVVVGALLILGRDALLLGERDLLPAHFALARLLRLLAGLLLVALLLGLTLSLLALGHLARLFGLLP